MMDAPAQKPPTLQYADAPPGIGLIIEPLPDGIRITKPPVRGYAIFLLVFLIIASPPAFLILMLGGGLEAVTLPIRIIRGAFKPIIIELNATTLSLLNIDINGRPHDLIRPRQDVYDIRFIEHSGNLFVRARGHDLIDIRPFHDPRILRWLAEVLRQTMGLENASKS